MMRRLLALFLATGVSACASSGVEELRKEIGEIKARVVAIEADIDTHTSGVGQTREAVRARISYGPLVRWTNAFNLRPATERTIAFQQTGHSGFILHQSHRCSTSQRRSGKEAQFSNHNVTRGAIVIHSLTATPQSDGLVLAAPLQADASTTVSASYRPPCANWNRFPPAGIKGHTRANAIFQFRRGALQNNALSYTIDMISPDRLDIEMSSDVGPFTVRFTVPVRNLATRLVDGDMSLLLDKSGNISLPDAQMISYNIATQNPHIVTASGAIELDTDVAIEIDKPDR